MEKTIIINGMSCRHCVARVEKALNRIDGVEAKVDLATRTANLNLSKPVSDDVIREAMDNVGYEFTFKES
ncbi:MAG: heavy-metal-associated domain-containing protein [Porphyromonadaceae bacterium]|nr:heavy-metal-associated domain-containing protein [Porphyromonadaceae bacterium]